MVDERDDFDDPQMADLLRGWGRLVRQEKRADDADDASSPPPAGSTLFEPPTDLSAMHRALRETDEGIASPSAGGGLRIVRTGWFRGGLALAASLTLIVTGWFLFRVSPQAEGPVVLALNEVRLSSAEDGAVMRGGAADRFPSGGPVYVYFVVDRPGVAYLAMLDSESQFALLRGDDGVVPHNELRPGENRLDISLDEHPGTETLIILASAEPLPDEQLELIINRAAGSVSPTATTHTQRLAAILDSLRSDPRLAIGYATFEHLPAGN